MAMTGALGLSESTSIMITKAAGVTEIIVGLLILAFYRNRLLIKMNILALALLCAYVAVVLPHVLMEAFNPVTTNLALIGLSYVLLNASGHICSGSADS